MLGILIDAVDYRTAVDRIVAAAHDNSPFSCTALAVHGVMTGVLDPVQRHRLNALDLVVPDGQPVRWALNLLYHLALKDRVYGPTLMLEVCAEAARERLPIFVYGSTEQVNRTLVERLQRLIPDLAVAGREPSKFRRVSPGEQDQIVGRIRGSGARITFVGLGCPRQEVWAYEYRQRLSMPILAVGAAFDFHSGNLAQAPQRLQRWGLEWAYRLAHEPRRLWRRYLLLNPAYTFLISLQALKLRRFDTDGSAPEHDVLFA